MAHLVEIAFKGNRKEFFLWEADELPPLRAPMIVDADRGEDLGTVHAAGELAERRSARVPHGLFGAPPSRAAKRLATTEDVRRLGDVRAQDDDARRRAMERVKANALVMKVTDAEWQWDRKKLTFYFTAEKRVDFRTLVRELASMFRTRIELKQIGVRDEARRLDGVGRCGRQYCSASWLPELRPVNLGVAKDQRLSLNPSQISGACGRLMCCLRYEHEFYVQSRKKYPKEGKPVRTARGEEKVLANDIFRERVTLRGVDGEIRTIPLAALREEMLVAGDPLVQTLASAALAASTSPAGALPVLDEDGTDDDETIETEHSPGPVAGAAVAVDPALDVTMEWPAPRAEQEEARRPQRRRGRRGGRRNRAGGANGTRTPRDEGAGPTGAP
ncbi:MAG TPA: regulatory iron-sulfur-containing complex subunit RicT [Gemmatimonadaceae bacterium]|nr:regulatory iron-sulfur-containing complex subunit RicT [Gemmatimonadaceae bacterium]